MAAREYTPAAGEAILKASFPLMDPALIEVASRHADRGVASRYDRELSGVFAVQEEIAREYRQDLRANVVCVNKPANLLNFGFDP